MRKSHEKIARAFFKGESASCHNAATDGNAVLLHGSRIVEKTEREGVYRVSLCGYNTVTTRAWINSVLNYAAQQHGRVHSYAGVWQSDGVCYYYTRTDPRNAPARELDADATVEIAV